MTGAMWGVMWGAMWAAAVVAMPAWWYRPAPARLRALGPPPERRRTKALPAPATFLGRVVRARLGRARNEQADRRLGWALIAAFVVVPVAPLLAPAAAAAAWAGSAWRARARRRREADLVRRGLPEVVDLFVVAIGAGLTVPLALREVAPLAPPPFGAAIDATLQDVGLGMRTADALESLPRRLGETVRPLSAALMASERYGVPLGAALERLADEVRRDRRRHAEAAARRVPVKLLFPLVFCSLPALALLSVAPLIAGALRALRT